MKFRTILIANRGEIANRVIRSCRDLGIGTVAVYSDADVEAPFVRLCDRAYPLGGLKPGESYLDIGKIIDAARKAKVDAIHPGYGFLSENDEFAQAVSDAGFVFIGPPAEAIRRMGDKVAARALAASEGIPTVPGSHAPLDSAAEAALLAEEVGYPVLLKAVGGGGGKGMRVVGKAADLEHAFERAKSEAGTAFGDERVYLEKYVTHPRHIEVQILADTAGNVIHLGERECSIQRRHQKIIEESPSTILDTKTRDRLTQAAVRFASSGGYQSAGTVEFLVDDQLNYYFLEMNARVQVEHPVTEMRTGIDIVGEQIRIAEGHPLSVKQEEVRFRGHALECRIYAEDPENSFFPSTGTILRLRAPSGPFIREDQGVEEGYEVTPHYDPLLSKLISWGDHREEAIARMKRALEEYEIHGLKTNVQYCLWVLSQADFMSGKTDTGLLDRLAYPGNARCAPAELTRMIAQLTTDHKNGGTAEAPSPAANWKQRRLDGYR